MAMCAIGEDVQRRHGAKALGLRSGWRGPRIWRRDDRVACFEKTLYSTVWLNTRFLDNGAAAPLNQIGDGPAVPGVVPHFIYS